MGLSVNAVFSPDRKYRYTLWRHWIGGTGYAMFIGLNPSTADEVADDPTIRRCIGFAKSWGYAGLCMTNLFAYRATNPADMIDFELPIGADNDKHIMDVAKDAGVIVAAWGALGNWRGRGRHMRALLPNLHYLKLTKDGHPAHPLYLPKTLIPIAWEAA